MDGQAPALRGRANSVEEMLAGLRARLHVHHHVGGNNFGDTALDGVADVMDVFEAGCAGNADGDVDEMAIAGAPNANPLGGKDSIQLVHGMRHLLLQTLGGGIEQHIERALAQSHAYPDHHRGHRQRGQGIGVTQPGCVPCARRPTRRQFQSSPRGCSTRR